MVATDPCISLLVCLPHIAIPSLMLPLKQFQSSADSWWLISSSVISVHMLSPAVPSDVCVVLALLSGPVGVCHHPTAVPSDVCVVLALLSGPGDVCHHPTAVPSDVCCTGLAFRPWRCLSSSYSSAQ